MTNDIRERIAQIIDGQSGAPSDLALARADDLIAAFPELRTGGRVRVRYVVPAPGSEGGGYGPPIYGKQLPDDWIDPDTPPQEDSADD